MTESPYRVLVIEDDDDVALFTRTVLQKRAGCEVRSLASADGAIRALSEFAPDVVITDVELPGASGLDILEQVRRADGDLPVVVMTAHASVDYAVRALRDRADEFLTKPIPSAVLVETVQRLATAYRESQARRRGRTVLAIGAHPDDVEIGVGGTLAAHAAAGDPVVILTLCRGARGGQADDRQNESLAAAELIGARLFLEDLEDTRIPISDPTVGRVASDRRSPNAATSWRRPQPRAPERPESSASPTSSCATATPASPPCSRSTPGGTVTIAVTVAGDDVVVSFADTGMGIPADEIDRLFTRFFRSSTAMRQAVQGVGLGLSITKAIVTAHGGSLGVESEQGVGTTFTMSLPIARVD